MTTYQAYDKTSLMTVLGQASGGDTIVLNQGDYNKVTFKNINFDSTVKLVSADVDNPVTFSNKTSIGNSSNLHFDNINFELTDIPATGVSGAYNSLLYFVKSSDITVENSNIQGQIIDVKAGQNEGDKNADGTRAGYAAGSGVSLAATSNINLINNEIHDLKFGISFRSGEDTLIKGNHIHDIRVDGIRGKDHQDTLVEDNVFSNFKRYIADPDNPNGQYDDHADMIQYWLTQSDTGIDNFQILNNLFFQTDGETQTIFGHARLSETDNQDVELTNFTVSGNIIYNGHSHGISLGGVNGALVEDNILLGNHRVDDKYSNAPRINIGDSENLNIHNNINGYSWDKAIRTKGDDYRDPSDDGIYDEKNISITDTVYFSSKKGEADYMLDIFKGLERKDITVEELKSIIQNSLDDLSLLERFQNTLNNTPASLNADTSPQTAPPADIDDEPSFDDPVKLYEYDNIIEAEGYTRAKDTNDLYKIGSIKSDVIGGAGNDIFEITEMSDYRFHRIRDFEDGDVLDISNVLEIESDDLSKLIQIEEVNWHGKSHSFINVDHDGNGEFDRLVILTHRDDLDVDQMVQDGSLVI